MNGMNKYLFVGENESLYDDLKNRFDFDISYCNQKTGIDDIGYSLVIIDCSNKFILDYLENRNTGVCFILVLDKNELSRKIIRCRKKYNIIDFAYRPVESGSLADKIRNFQLSCSNILVKSRIEQDVIDYVKHQVNIARRLGGTITLVLVSFVEKKNFVFINNLLVSLNAKNEEFEYSMRDTDSFLRWNNCIIAILIKCHDNDIVFVREKIKKHTAYEIAMVHESFRFTNWTDNIRLDIEGVLLSLDDKLKNVIKTKNLGIKLVKDDKRVLL